MSFKWSDDLETGNISIDNQHKMLFSCFNNLMNACSHGQGRQDVDIAIDFLTKYAIQHFADEEDLQLECGYPRYLQHKEMHDNFTKTVSVLCNELATDGPTFEILGKVNTQLVDWLIDHIKTEDADIANYIKSQNEFYVIR